MSLRRLAIIGAGPIGLEAALLGRERGFEVTVLEKGRVGESLRRFAEAFAKTGYKWKLLQIQGRPMLVAIHPGT